MDLHAHVHRQAGRRQLGPWKDYLHYVDYAVAATIVIAAIYFYVRWRRRRNDLVQASGEPAADAGS